MALPQFNEEDLRVLDRALATLIKRSEASMAMLIDQAGFLITQAGDSANFDTTTLAALAAGTFAATQSMASLTRETNFSSVYQQGNQSSLLVLSVNTTCLLLVVFRTTVSVGAVKYYALTTVAEVALQLEAARQRDPSSNLDLAALNLEDSGAFFRRKALATGS
jgi:predicted regulator of Ras-like GTPase activity (Roadblock/LC7/MglB family)